MKMDNRDYSQLLQDIADNQDDLRPRDVSRLAQLEPGRLVAISLNTSYAKLICTAGFVNHYVDLLGGDTVFAIRIN